MFRNNDGFITKKEMLSSTSKLTPSQVEMYKEAPTLTIQRYFLMQVSAVFDRNDVNKDGKLSKQEFKEMFCKTKQ